jgi:1-acyl-sn-glycerol-3-phosphate acyltransferase
MDSLSVFSFVRKDDPIIFLQHNFNKVVTATSKWIWGAYTIDKDDKTYKGKAALEAQLQELVRIMEVTENLTLIVYAQGKVPKTVEETRNPSRFFPGAFYLAMMAGYPVVPLVNDYREGVLVNTCLEPIYLHREYSSRIRHYPLVRRFRRANKPLIDEIGERFVRLFRDQYEVIERDERAAYKTKRDVLYACGKIKN